MHEEYRLCALSFPSPACVLIPIPQVQQSVDMFQPLPWSKKDKDSVGCLNNDGPLWKVDPGEILSWLKFP